MEVRTLVKKGTEHLTYCEDSVTFVVTDTETPLYIGAVFDGCSTGLESHFASALLSKLLRKAIKGLNYNNSRAPLPLIMNLLFHKIFNGLEDISTLLGLRDLEMVSTMIICIIRDNEVYILSSGDGVIKVDDKLIILESKENAPDYLAYYLEDLASKVMLEHTNSYSFTFEKDVSICTDGICSFRDSIKQDVTADVIDSLLNDRTIMGSDAMLSRKYNILAKKGYRNFDDVGIVRFIKEFDDESI